MTAKSYVDIHGRNKTDRAFNQVKGNLTKLDSFSRKLSGGLAGLAGGLVVAKMVAFGKSSIDAADNIQKLGIKTGATAELLSEMRFALSQSAVSQGEFETALRKINKSTADAAAGLSTQTRAFDALGISIEDFQNLNTDQKFITLSEAMSKVKDPATRTQVAMDIMGRSGESLLTVMENGAEGIANYREEAIALGQSLSQDQVDAAAAANDALDKLSKSISGGFSQSILNYTGQIKQAADFTREYLPRSIEFLIDIFRGLKAVVQGVVLAILTSYKKLFQAAEKLPLGLGENFKGVANFFTEAADIIEIHLEENISKMGQWRQSSVDAAREIKKSGAVIKSDFVPALSSIKPPAKASKEEIKRLADEAKRAAKVVKELEKAGIGFANNIPKRAAEELADAMKTVSNETFEASRRQQEFDAALKDGSIRSGKEAAAVAQELGVKYKDLSKETKSVTTVMAAEWERFKDSAFDSLKTFYRSGLDGTKSFSESIKNLFKDMVAGILAQITSMIASNVFQKFLGYLTGNSFGNSNQGIFDFSSGNKGGTKGAATNAVSSQVSSYIQTAVIKPVATYVGNALGITTATTAASTAASSAAAASAAASVAGASAATIAAANAAATAASVAGGATATALSAGYTGSAVALGTTGTAGASSAAAGLSATGYGAIVVAAIAAIAALSGNSRSPQQIGLDQLQEVDDATKAGRNTQVENLRGSGVSFLGGFNEASTFFGAAGIGDKDLDKVGDLLKQRYGFDQAFGLKDGILRLVDEDRKFSENHEQITTEVLATIAEVKLGFTDAEQGALAAMGNAASGIDALFDSTIDSGKTTSERLIDAYSKFYKVSTEKGEKWLKDSNVSVDRWGEIFTETSGDVLNTIVSLGDKGSLSLTGLSENGIGAANVIKASFGEAANDISNGLDGVLDNSERIRNQIRDNWNTLGSEIKPINVSITASSPQGQPTQNKSLERKLDQVISSNQEKTRAELETMRQLRDAG